MSLYSDNKIKLLFLIIYKIKMHLLNVNVVGAGSQHIALCQYIMHSCASLIDLMSSATGA
jgi:hypothetical protein